LTRRPRLAARGIAILAVAISFWLGLLAVHAAELVAFGDCADAPPGLLPQIAAFSLLVLFNFGFRHSRHEAVPARSADGRHSDPGSRCDHHLELLPLKTRIFSVRSSTEDVS
jgi:hypothetical protein